VICNNKKTDVLCLFQDAKASEAEAMGGEATPKISMREENGIPPV
jgi:hypothetical protein